MANFNSNHLQEILRLHMQSLSPTEKNPGEMGGGGRRERKKLQTRGLLMESAWALFENFGYERVSMEQIAAVAEISKVTLYKYFPAKESLLCEKLNAEISFDINAVDSHADKITVCVTQLVSWACTYRIYLPTYISYRLASPPTDENGLAHIFSQMTKCAAHHVGAPSPLPPARLGCYLEMLCLGAMRHWLDNPDFELDQELHQLLRLGLGWSAPTPAQAEALPYMGE
ncbi:TetR/AcrR family transcriptional regulator [Zoogloea sp.]|uniref:TetR/AcrR family transcriptional regulator n=1 Tax=Zoogloea sp. TaxID=49181 RepID=UPI0035AE5E94